MKSFFEQFEGRIANGEVPITQREYEDIQLYAYRDGMSRAAELVRKSYCIDGMDISAEIEYDRDFTDTVWPRPVV